MIFHLYRNDSVKNTREKRGTGKRRKVEKKLKILGNWKEFLSVSENKTSIQTNWVQVLSFPMEKYCFYRLFNMEKQSIIYNSFPRINNIYFERTLFWNFGILQRFVCQLYGEDGIDVNECRLSMLVHKGASFDNMPPTMDALYLHTLRTSHQSGNIWSYFNKATYNERYYTEWGYGRNGSGNSEPI